MLYFLDLIMLFQISLVYYAKLLICALLCSDFGYILNSSHVFEGLRADIRLRGAVFEMVYLISRDYHERTLLGTSFVMFLSFLCNLNLDLLFTTVEHLDETDLLYV